MSGRLSKVIGKSKFLNLDDFLISCYIVKVSSPLLDEFLTTGAELFYLYSNLHYFPFLRNYVSCNPLTSFRKVQALLDPENNCPAQTQRVSLLLFQLWVSPLYQ